MERTSKSPDKCPHDKLTDKNNCEVGKSRGVSNILYIHTYLMCIYIHNYTHIYMYLFVSIKGAMIMMRILPWWFLPHPSLQWHGNQITIPPAGPSFFAWQHLPWKATVLLDLQESNCEPRFAFGESGKSWPNRDPNLSAPEIGFFGNKRQRTSVCWQAMPGGTVGCPDHCQMLPLAAW